MRGVRKLAALCIGFSAAVFAAHYVLEPDKLLPAAAICFAGALSGLAFKKNTGLRIMLLLCAAAVGFLSYKYKADTILEPCEAMAGRETSIRAVVTAYPEQRKSCTMLYVRFNYGELSKIDGVLFDYSGAAESLRPGDEICAEVKLLSAQNRYNTETDVNISKGLYVLGYIKGGCLVTGHGDNDLIYFPKHISHALQEKIKEIFPENSAHFMQALLTGDKTEYYGDDKLSTSMNIAGLAHVVAVSGMHVAFLVGFLMTVMGMKRSSALICIGLVWIFVVMTGASPSAVRAGVMQTMLLSAYLFRRDSDNLTMLSFAMALILFFNPFACGSISLQLSFGAMAGIMLFTQPVYGWLTEKISVNGRIPNRLISYTAGALAGSLAATAFTVPLIAVHFGYVSVFAPFANMLCLWCISTLFCGGYIICLLGFVFPAAAKFLAAVISYLVQYIAVVVKWIADIPFSAVYVENRNTVLWLAVSYGAFALFTIIRRKRRISALLPIGIAVVGFSVLLISMHLNMLSDPGTITVMDVGNGQCISVTAGENTVVVDCGSSGISENAGFMLSSSLHSQGRDNIDILVLTHIKSDHANGVCRLLNSVNVKTLILPAHAEENNGLLNEILTTAKENDVEVVFADRDKTYSCGEIKLWLYALESNKGALAVSADIGGYTMLVMGDAYKKTEKELAEREDLSDTELLVVSYHGSKNSSCEEFLGEVDPDVAVISVGNNSYGHPAQETLDRLRETEAEIYRTDLSGRFVLRLD